MSDPSLARQKFEAILAKVDPPRVIIGQSGDPPPDAGDWHSATDAVNYGRWVDERVDETDSQVHSWVVQNVTGPNAPAGQKGAEALVTYLNAVQGSNGWEGWKASWKAWWQEVSESHWLLEWAYDDIAARHVELRSQIANLNDHGIAVRAVSEVPKHRDPTDKVSNMLYAVGIAGAGIAAVMLIKQFK